MAIALEAPPYVQAFLDVDLSSRPAREGFFKDYRVTADRQPVTASTSVERGSGGRVLAEQQEVAAGRKPEVRALRREQRELRGFLQTYNRAARVHDASQLGAASHDLSGRLDQHARHRLSYNSDGYLVQTLEVSRPSLSRGLGLAARAWIELVEHNALDPTQALLASADANGAREYTTGIRHTLRTRQRQAIATEDTAGARPADLARRYGVSRAKVYDIRNGGPGGKRAAELPGRTPPKPGRKLGGSAADLEGINDALSIASTSEWGATDDT